MAQQTPRHNLRYLEWLLLLPCQIWLDMLEGMPWPESGALHKIPLICLSSTSPPIILDCFFLSGGVLFRLGFLRWVRKGVRVGFDPPEGLEIEQEQPPPF